MKTKLATAAAATAIALTGMSAAPANALTRDETFLLIAGLTAFAVISSGHHTPHATPAPSPVTYSTGPILLKQSHSANFDTGTVNTSGSDMWFHAVDPWHRYLTPISGARMAVGDRSNRGYYGCSAAHYSTHRVNITAMPVGSYVCVKTNAGRISQFRVNAVYGGAVRKMRLGYTTWR